MGLDGAAWALPVGLVFLAVYAGMVLGLVTTLAGNLLLVGSVANLIVADLARRDGVEVDWRAHARIGVPVTLLSLLGVAWALAG